MLMKQFCEHRPSKLVVDYDHVTHHRQCFNNDKVCGINLL